MVKSYKNMREIANRTGWGTDEKEHKQQELHSEAGITVKDHILKKCPWFYEFEDIFHKHPTVSPPILIESDQPARPDGTNVKDTELGGFDFDLEKTLEFYGEERDMKMEAQANHDGDDDSDSDLHSVFSQIARDERRNERKKRQGNADQEKESGAAIRPELGSETSSENESEDAPIDVPRSTQPSYLLSRCNRLESKTPTRSNTNTQLSSRKRNHDRARQSSSAQEGSQKRNHDLLRQSRSPEP